MILNELVGERGFEPPTPWSRTRCSTRLSHSPTDDWMTATTGTAWRLEPNQYSILRSSDLGPRHAGDRLAWSPLRPLNDQIRRVRKGCYNLGHRHIFPLLKRFYAGFYCKKALDSVGRCRSSFRACRTGSHKGNLR